MFVPRQNKERVNHMFPNRRILAWKTSASYWSLHLPYRLLHCSLSSSPIYSSQLWGILRTVSLTFRSPSRGKLSSYAPFQIKNYPWGRLGHSTWHCGTGHDSMVAGNGSFGPDGEGSRTNRTLSCKTGIRFFCMSVNLRRSLMRFSHWIYNAFFVLFFLGQLQTW